MSTRENIRLIARTPFELSPMWTYDLNFIFFINQNICCGYSKELSQWDGSFEHPKHMFKLMCKKIMILRWRFCTKVLLCVSVYLVVQHYYVGSSDVRWESLPRVGGEVWLVPGNGLSITHPYMCCLHDLQTTGYLCTGNLAFIVYYNNCKTTMTTPPPPLGQIKK